jgi:hypothetical protein
LRLEIEFKVLFVLHMQALDDTDNLSLPDAGLSDFKQPLAALHLDGELLGHNFGLFHVLKALELCCSLEADGTLVKAGPPRTHHSVTPSSALFFLFVVIARGAFL